MIEVRLNPMIKVIESERRSTFLVMKTRRSRLEQFLPMTYR